MQENKKEFFKDAWPEVYASRQTDAILTWEVTGVEEKNLRDDKVLCLVVQKNGVRGYIPLSESGVKISDDRSVNRARLSRLLGQEIGFVVIALDIDSETFVASRRQAMEIMAGKTWAGLKKGAVVTAVARRIITHRRRDGYVFAGVAVEIEGVEAVLPASEITYGWIDEILEVIQPGDVFDVKVLEADRDKEKVVVSVKALLPNPWPQAAKRYAKGMLCRGTVTGVTRYGIFVALEPGVNALCRHMRSGVPGKNDVVAVAIDRVTLKENAGRIEGRALKIIRRAG